MEFKPASFFFYRLKDPFVMQIPSIRELTTPGVIHFKLSDPSSLSQDYIEVFKALWTL